MTRDRDHAHRHEEKTHPPDEEVGRGTDALALEEAEPEGGDEKDEPGDAPRDRERRRQSQLQ